MAAGGGELGGVQRAVQGEGGLQILDLAPPGGGAGEHTSQGLERALEPRACAGSVTRQTRRQFCQNIFLICLNDQTIIACLMIIRGV